MVHIATTLGSFFNKVHYYRVLVAKEVILVIFKLEKSVIAIGIIGALGRNRTCDLDSGGPRDIHFTTRACFQHADSIKISYVLLVPFIINN